MKDRCGFSGVCNLKGHDGLCNQVESGTCSDRVKQDPNHPLPEPPHTVSVATHMRAAIQHLKDAEIVLQIERERLENLIK